MAGRRPWTPLRASRNGEADPVFYLKAGNGELIPPKVREFHPEFRANYISVNLEPSIVIIIQILIFP
jgi:hypothetical protein